MSYHFCCFRTLNQDTCPINVFELGQEVLSVVWKMCNTDKCEAVPWSYTNAVMPHCLNWCSVTWTFYHWMKVWPNKRVSQMQAPLAACREPAGDQNKPPKALYVYEHKTQYNLIHAPHTNIVAFWHISNITHQGFHRFKFAIIPPCFISQQYMWNIAVQPTVGCSDL